MRLNVASCLGLCDGERREKQTFFSSILRLWEVYVVHLGSLSGIFLFFFFLAESTQIPDTSASTTNSENGKARYNRSVSCHLGDQLQYRYHATKSRNEGNLDRLKMDMQAAKPSKRLQRPDKHDSVSSLGSLNSYLSICEGLDADCSIEGEAVFSDDIAEENNRQLLQASATVRQRQSVISGFSLNSLLSLVEADSHVNSTLTSGDNPTISLDVLEESRDSKDKVLNQNEPRERNESSEKGREGRTTGRTTTEERSQTGRVSSMNLLAR